MLDFGRILDGVADPRTSNGTRHDLHEMLLPACWPANRAGESFSVLHQGTIKLEGIAATCPSRGTRFRHGIKGFLRAL